MHSAATRLAAGGSTAEAAERHTVAIEDVEGVDNHPGSGEWARGPYSGTRRRRVRGGLRAAGCEMRDAGRVDRRFGLHSRPMLAGRDPWTGEFKRSSFPADKGPGRIGLARGASASA